MEGAVMSKRKQTVWKRGWVEDGPSGWRLSRHFPPRRAPCPRCRKTNEMKNRFNNEEIMDILFVITYSGRTPERPE
jgi:hypothetical protein